MHRGREEPRRRARRSAGCDAASGRSSRCIVEAGALPDHPETHHALSMRAKA
jgi:hypothetical protein